MVIAPEVIEPEPPVIKEEVDHDQINYLNCVTSFIKDTKNQEVMMTLWGMGFKDYVANLKVVSENNADINMCVHLLGAKK